jgi:hypothetical protein
LPALIKEITQDRPNKTPPDRIVIIKPKQISDIISSIVPKA